MAKPVRNSLGPLLLHHGCDRSLAELVLEGKTSPIPSENKYDWLARARDLLLSRQPLPRHDLGERETTKKARRDGRAFCLGSLRLPRALPQPDGLCRCGVGVGGACRNAVGIRNQRRKQTYGNADALLWRAASVESSSCQALAASRSPSPEPSATASPPASSQGSTSPGLRPPAAMQ